MQEKSISVPILKQYLKECLKEELIKDIVHLVSKFDSAKDYYHVKINPKNEASILKKYKQIIEEEKDFKIIKTGEFDLSDAQYIKINEVVSSNSKGITDEDGDTSDWIELYNTSSTVAVNMYNLIIADSGSQWAFPNVIIQPNQYLLVWADSIGSAPFCPGLKDSIESLPLPIKYRTLRVLPRRGRA